MILDVATRQSGPGRESRDLSAVILGTVTGQLV